MKKDIPTNNSKRNLVDRLISDQSDFRTGKLVVIK
jgi:hypothetical protein